jgi:hypothetical protein
MQLYQSWSRASLLGWGRQTCVGSALSTGTSAISRARRESERGFKPPFGAVQPEPLLSFEKGWGSSLLSLSSGMDWFVRLLFRRESPAPLTKRGAAFNFLAAVPYERHVVVDQRVLEAVKLGGNSRQAEAALPRPWPVGRKST